MVETPLDQSGFTGSLCCYYYYYYFEYTLFVHIFPMYVLMGCFPVGRRRVVRCRSGFLLAVYAVGEGRPKFYIYLSPFKHSLFLFFPRVGCDWNGLRRMKTDEITYMHVGAKMFSAAAFPAP